MKAMARQRSHSIESIAVEVTAAAVRDTAEVEEAIAKLGREPGGGLIVPPDAFTLVHHQLLIRLAQQHRVPAVYAFRPLVAQGALMSYGPDPYDMFRRSASYVDRILKGAKPADLPRSAANEVRTGHQPQDRQGTRPPNSRQAARHRRRGDRMKRREFIVHGNHGQLSASRGNHGHLTSNQIGRRHRPA
jgi:hypothetical protein